MQMMLLINSLSHFVEDIKKIEKTMKRSDLLSTQFN